MDEWVSVHERLPEATCGWFLVFLAGGFQKHHIVWWNVDLTFNGAETNWEDFSRWRLITHWQKLTDPRQQVSASSEPK